MPNVEGAKVTLNADQLFTPDNNLVEFINVAKNLQRFQVNPAVDAALVQFFLTRIYNSSMANSRPFTKGPLKVDGVYGEITETFIKHFQTNAHIEDQINPRKPIPLRGDGIVNRAAGNTLASRFLAIYRLNWAVARLEPSLYALLLESARQGILSVGGLAAVAVPV